MFESPSVGTCVNPDGAVTVTSPPFSFAPTKQTRRSPAAIGEGSVTEGAVLTPVSSLAEFD